MNSTIKFIIILVAGFLLALLFIRFGCNDKIKTVEKPVYIDPARLKDSLNIVVAASIHRTDSIQFIADRARITASEAKQELRSEQNITYTLQQRLKQSISNLTPGNDYGISENVDSLYASMARKDKNCNETIQAFERLDSNQVKIIKEKDVLVKGLQNALDTSTKSTLLVQAAFDANEKAYKKALRKTKARTVVWKVIAGAAVLFTLKQNL